MKAFENVHIFVKDILPRLLVEIKTKKIFDLIHQRFSESKRRKHKSKSLNHKSKHFTF